MRPAKWFLIAAVLTTPLVLAHCSSDDAAAPPSDEHYLGVLAGASDVSGLLDLAPDSADATKLAGTVRLNVAGTASVPVSGTIDSSGAFSVAGGSMQFTGKLVEGVVSGTYASEWGVGQFSVGRGAGLRNFCGQFDGSYHGRWNLFTVGGIAAGVFAAPAIQGGLLGTVANQVSGEERLVLHIVGPGGLAEGSLTGTTLTGGWSFGDSSTGSFVASEIECASLPTPGSRGDGGDDDFTFDASTPPDDERDATVPASDAGSGDASVDGGDDAGVDGDAGEDEDGGGDAGAEDAGDPDAG